MELSLNDIKNMQSCPLCADARPVRLSYVDTESGDIGPFGDRFFCSTCELDYMRYTGLTSGMPEIVCDLTIRNLKVVQTATLSYLKKTSGIREFPMALVCIISEYTWFPMAVCSFRHLPDFPRGAALTVVRPCDSAAEHRSGVETVVTVLGYPGDTLVLNESDTRFGLQIDESRMPKYYARLKGFVQTKEEDKKKKKTCSPTRPGSKRR